MTGQSQDSTERTSRKRIASALCTAGIVAIALSGNLVGAGGQQPAVPGEPVAEAPTQVAADPAPAGEPSAPATTTPARDDDARGRPGPRADAHRAAPLEHRGRSPAAGRRAADLPSRRHPAGAARATQGARTAG